VRDPVPKNKVDGSGGMTPKLDLTFMYRHAHHLNTHIHTNKYFSKPERHIYICVNAIRPIVSYNSYTVA
jgi:ribosomal protein S15P/S13E